MREPGSILKKARQRAQLSQRALAALAGTSGPTVAAYESGRVEPKLSTLRRLVAATGMSLEISVTPEVLRLPATQMTREERRSLFLHEAIARKIRNFPDEALVKARKNLATMRGVDTSGHAGALLNTWAQLLESGDLDRVVEAITNPHQSQANDLRQNTVFAGVLSPQERWGVYREFIERQRCEKTS